MTAFAPGDRLGPYEIVEAIGAGGMGEVYRGRDESLNRDVAIKVLPSSMAGDPDRLARFKREARVLASLNHPNIAHVYGFDGATLQDGTTVNFLAMEMVEGEDLADRLRRGPIAVDDALAIARQVADGLEEAHEQGIVHRDLKPANIKVTPDGKVKILDFGLAKAFEGEPADSGSMSLLAHSPTLSRHMTEAGLVLGTAAYMSPEQARGKRVDRRTDIWAFGVVLYEMLSGQRLFAGETVSDTLAAVLRADPDWSRLPVDTPAAAIRLLRRCLERDAKRRLGWIGGVAHELDQPELTTREPLIAATPLTVPAWRRALPLAAAAVVGALVLELVSGVPGWRRVPRPNTQVSRLTMEFGGDPAELAISPDGSRVLASSARSLELRSMSDFEAVPLKIADLQPRNMANVVFSPDGQSIAFTADTMLERIPVSGGAVVPVAQLSSSPHGCSWTGDYLYCALGAQGIVRVAASGGAVEQLITLAAGEHAGTPELLPDGDAVLFTLAPGTQRPEWQRSSIVVQALSSGKREVIAASGSDPHYLPTGHVAFVLGGVWFAVPVDIRVPRPTGSPVAMVQGIGRRNQGGLLQPRAVVGVSTSGTLVYRPGSVSLSNENRVVFADREGHERTLALDPKEYQGPRVSPDGRQLAISTDAAEEAAVWVYDLSEAHAIRRLTFAGRNRLPVWAPDGKRLAFQADRAGDTAIFVQDANGAGDAARLTKAEAGTVHVPESWSKDGRYLSFSVVSTSGAELWLRSMTDGTSARFGDVHSNAPLNSAFSPDGKWIAYTERGRSGATPTAVFVQPVPATGARFQISSDSDSGHHPFWSPEGKQLFHWAFGGSVLVSASMDLHGSVTSGRPVRVPGLHPSNTTALGPLNYDITPDGREFVFTRTVSEAPASTDGTSERASVKVVLNWFEELRRIGAKQE